MGWVIWGGNSPGEPWKTGIQRLVSKGRGTGKIACGVFERQWIAQLFSTRHGSRCCGRYYVLFSDELMV